MYSLINFILFIPLITSYAINYCQVPIKTSIVHETGKPEDWKPEDWKPDWKPSDKESGEDKDKSDTDTSDEAKRTATMSWNEFFEGGSGGWASKCTERFHDESEKVCALSTGLLDNDKNCGKTVRIFANGKTSSCTVVDECDENEGYDEMHAFLPPCKSNIIDSSKVIWNELGIDTELGLVDIQYIIDP